MKKIFLFIVAGSLFFCGCKEKVCYSQITAEKGVHNIQVDGEYKTVMSGDKLDVPQNSIIKLRNNNRIYKIDECNQLYVIVQDDYTDYLYIY